LSEENMENEKQDGRKRKNIEIGKEVEIVQKHDQRSGKWTRGVVQSILTKSATHPHGIKVQLESGEVGRVKKVT
jgi:uncharacterized repeat protein (TIGR03833 family)